VQRQLHDVLASNRASQSQRLRIRVAAAVKQVLSDGTSLSVSKGGDAILALNGINMPIGNELAALPALPLPNALLDSADTSHVLEAILIAVKEHTPVLLNCAADAVAKLGLVQVMVACMIAP
jgi:hypothetical protein